MAKASAILLNAARALTDERDHRRWPLPELFAYLKDGLWELLEKRPDIFSESRSHNLQAGTRQSVPNVHAVLRVKMNVDRTNPTVRGRAIRQVTLAHLDNFDPYWHGNAAKSEVINYVLDGIDKAAFWVSPPNDGTGAVELDVALEPESMVLASGANPNALASYDVDIPIESQFAPALTYYVLHRAWAKDADYAANQQNSNRYYELFLTAIGVTK